MNALEIIARAICVKRGHNPDGRQREYGQSSYEFWTWELFSREADAILSALSLGGLRVVPAEPTQDMVQAYFDMRESKDAENEPYDPEDIYRAMIAAALEPTPPKSQEQR